MLAPYLAGGAHRPLLPAVQQWMLEVEGICLYWSFLCSSIIINAVGEASFIPALPMCVVGLWRILDMHDIVLHETTSPISYD